MTRAGDAIARLRKLHEAASPGPWEASTDQPADVVVFSRKDFLGNVGEPSVHRRDAIPPGATPVYESCPDDERDAANAALIVAARAALPVLVDFLEGAVANGGTTCIFPLPTSPTCGTCSPCRARAALEKLERETP